MKKIISIVIPLYNEEKSISSTISSLKYIIKKIANEYNVEIIAVNDGSTDNTKTILKKIKGIKVIEHPYNLGYGASLKDGLRHSDGEWILITDADGTYPINEIPNLLRYTNDYDMVVGARTGKNVSIPLLRLPAKWIIGKIANFMTGKKIDDVNSGLRVFDRKKALEFIKLYPSGFSFTTTITLAFITNDYTIKYLPINYFKRRGKSSIRPIKDFIGFIALIFRVVMYFKPLKFFFIPGLFSILIGIIYGIIQLKNSGGLGEFPILFILGGILICYLGVTADMIVKR